MILLRLFLPFKKLKERILREEEERIRKSFSNRILAFETEQNSLLEIRQSELDERKIKLDELELSLSDKEKEFSFKQRELEDSERRLNERKLELAEATEETKVKIRIAEAKSSPKSIWIESFSQGFSKAWDMMMPLMEKGQEKLNDQVKRKATDQVIQNLEPVIQARIESLKLTSLQPLNDLVKKRKEFEEKLRVARSEADRVKYRSYVEALNWCLDGNHLQKG